MVKVTLSSLLAATSLASLALAHPGEHEHHDEEAHAKQELYSNMVKRGLAACESHPDYIALQQRAQQRRWEKAQHLRKKRGIALDAPFKSRFRRRDTAALEAFEKLNHNKTSSGYTESTSASVLFASYKNSSCILAPEVTFGPYYVEGEYFRTDVTETQAGVKAHIEYQYIDVNTCNTPTSDLYIETWSANSTGVYAGVVASGNGDSSDMSNLNNTFLRGVTKVQNGVGAFDALIPGHYTGRTNHIHLMTHIGGTVYPNNTYKGSNVAHVGQLFFDPDLLDQVEATAPYNTNTQTRTTNDEDSIAAQEAGNGFDPFPDYAYLGNDLSDGLLVWISVGINMSSSYTVSPAATLTEDGGVADSENSMGGGGSGNGTAPSGGFNGTAPSGGAGGPSGAAFGSGSRPSGTAPTGMGGPSGSSTTTNSAKKATTTKKSSTTKKASTTAKAGSHTSSSVKTSHSTTKASAKKSSTTSSPKKSSTKSTKHSSSTTSTKKVAAKSSTTTTKKHSSTKSTSHKPTSSIATKH